MKDLLCFILLIGITIHALPASAQKKKEIKSIELECSRDKAIGVSPGASVRIGVIATQKNGKQRRTKGLSGGTGMKALDWKDVIVTVEGGKYSHEDYLLVTGDPRELKTMEVKITVTMKDDPSLAKSIVLPVNFREKYSASFQGYPGPSGKDGKDRTRIIVVDGNDGDNGENGEDGGNGHQLEVFVASGERDSVNMLKVYIVSKSNNTEQRYLIDPRGGSLFISVDGGSGGSGGDGGDGSNGGNARDSTHSKGAREAGNAGNGGNGGKGGNAGDAGKITFYVDPSARSLFSLIKWSAQGGAGGKGGEPGKAGSPGSASDTYPAGKEGVNGIAGRNGAGGFSAGEPEIIFKEVKVDF